MTTPKSWKKLTATLIYLAAGILLTLLQTFLHQGQTPDTAAATITLLILGGLVTTIFILTQGKVDLAKFAGEGTPLADLLEQRLATLITPALQKLADAGPSATDTGGNDRQENANPGKVPVPEDNL